MSSMLPRDEDPLNINKNPSDNRGIFMVALNAMGSQRRGCSNLNPQPEG